MKAELKGRMCSTRVLLCQTLGIVPCLFNIFDTRTVERAVSKFPASYLSVVCPDRESWTVSGSPSDVDQAVYNLKMGPCQRDIGTPEPFYRSHFWRSKGVTRSLFVAGAVRRVYSGNISGSMPGG